MSIDILDLRDLADELDELREERDGGEEYDADRLAALESLEGELGDSLRTVGEDYEPTLIAERDFVEYAQEFAEDVGAIPDDNPWPLYCIDWERAARELRMDYTAVMFDGADYLIRSW